MDTHAAHKHRACVKREEVQSGGFGLDLQQVVWIKLNPYVNLFKQKQTGYAVIAPYSPLLLALPLCNTNWVTSNDVSQPNKDE